MFRNPISELANDVHVIAPDLPGFDFSGTPDRRRFAYTFGPLGAVMAEFVITPDLAASPTSRRARRSVLSIFLVDPRPHFGPKSLVLTMLRM